MKKSITLAVVAVVTMGGALVANGQPQVPVPAPPTGPMSALAQNAAPVVQGSVSRYLLNPNGDVDGLLLCDAVHSAMATAPVVAGRNGSHASGPVSARLCEGTLDACASSMISILELFRRGPARDAPAPRCLKAFKSLSVESLAEARRRAEQVLAKAKRCPRCRTLLNHVFDCLGSTLFIDDDPHVLIGAFKPTERDQFSEQVLAAIIVLRGRIRTFPQHA